jgi:hypothetical protein
MSAIPSIDSVRDILIELQELKGQEVPTAVLRKYAPNLQALADADRQRVIDDAESLLPEDRRPLAADCVVARLQYEPKCALDLLTPLLAALDKHGRRMHLYTFAGSFVEAIEGARGGIEFKPLTGNVLAAKLGTHIQIGTTSKNGLKRESCPKDLRDAVLTQAHKAPSLEIRQVSRTPLWRAGKLQSGNGPNGDTWITAPLITLPSPCDKAAALAAFERLSGDWLGEFPFASDLDRSAAVAALLSASVRTSIRTPAIAITKPSHGAGASCLTNLISVVLAGSRAAMLNGAATGEEMTKQVDAVQRSAGALLGYDNIPPVVGFNNEVIAQVISEEVRGVRPFFSNSQLVNVENRQLVILNGVNLRLADDLLRRTLPIELDPQMERPETRSFKRPDLIEDAITHRVELLRDCYIILTAYVASGERVQTRDIAGFESWRALVPAALVWLGQPDVVESQKKLKAADPISADLHTLAHIWSVLFGEQAVTTVELVDCRSHFGEGSDSEEEAAARVDLTELLGRIAEDRRGNVSAKTLGYKLRAWKGRVVGDRQLHADGIAHGGAVKWRLRRIEQKKPAAAQAEPKQPKSGNTIQPSDAPAPQSEPKPNCHDASWRVGPLQSYAIPCPRAEAEHARSAFAHCGIEVTAKSGDGDKMIFVASMPADEAAANALLAEVNAEIDRRAAAEEAA